MQDTIQQENMQKHFSNDNGMCFNIHGEQWIITPLCFIQIQAFLIFPTKFIGIILFSLYFPYWMCIFNLKCPQYQTRPLFTTQMHNRASFMYSKTFWLLTGVYILKYCNFVSFVSGKLRAISVKVLVSALKNQLFWWRLSCLTSGMYSSSDFINIYTLSTNRNKYKSHTAVTQANSVLMGMMVDLWWLSDFWGL